MRLEAGKGTHSDQWCRYGPAQDVILVWNVREGAVDSGVPCRAS